MKAGGTEGRGRGAGARTTIHGSQANVVKAAGHSQFLITPTTMRGSEAPLERSNSMRCTLHVLMEHTLSARHCVRHWAISKLHSKEAEGLQ